MGKDPKARRKKIRTERTRWTDKIEQPSYHALRRFLTLTYEINDIAFVLASAVIQREHEIARKYAFALATKLEDKKKLLKQIGYNG